VLNPQLLVGRHAVVTGAARGIGTAVARELAAAGASITLLDRSDSEAAVASIQRAGGQANHHRLDVTDRAAIADIFDDLDRVDILVTSAGVYGEPIALDDVKVVIYRLVGISPLLVLFPSSHHKACGCGSFLSHS